MKIVRKNIIVAGVILMLLLALAACGGGGRESETAVEEPAVETEAASEEAAEPEEAEEPEATEEPEVVEEPAAEPEEVAAMEEEAAAEEEMAEETEEEAAPEASDENALTLWVYDDGRFGVLNELGQQFEEEFGIPVVVEVVDLSEKFHGAVVSHAGHERTRTFQEVTAVGKLLAQLQPVVDSANQAEVALIYDFQNEWALNMAQLPRSKDKNYQARCLAHYRPFWQQGITVDIINSAFADLSPYKLLIAPMLYLLPESLAEQLRDFVRACGTLVTTYLSGIVDQSDLVFWGGAPGPLKELLGIWVEETDVLFDHHQQTIQPVDKLLPNTSYPVKQYADIIHLQGAESLAVYEQDFYAGSPALTVNQFGEGRAYYLGARYDEALLLEFYRWLGNALGLDTAVAGPLPASVTAQVRKTENERFIFLLNFNESSQVIKLDDIPYLDAVSGQTVSGEITLPGYGLRILRQ